MDAPLYYCHAGRHWTRAPFSIRKKRKLCARCDKQAKQLHCRSNNAMSGHRRDVDKGPNDGKCQPEKPWRAG